jgi:hypothetical protein
MYAARPKPRPPRRDGRNPARNRMNVLFTMSNNPPRNGRQGNARTGPNAAEPKPDSPQDANRRTKSPHDPNGGARRDRTDDLMLAKHALSQLSYGPIEDAPRKWWAWEDLNFRPHAYQARALTN